MATGEIQAAGDGKRTVPRAAAWLHAGLTLFILGVVGWAYLESREAYAHGCMEAMSGSFLLWLVVLPLSFVGIVALSLTVLLFLSVRGGVVLTLIYDVLVGSLAFLGMVLAIQEYVSKGGGELAETLWIAAVTSALVLLVGAGLTLLLTGCYGWKRAWWGFAVLIILTLALVGWPPLFNFSNVLHVRVVRSYMATHLLRIPLETPVEVMRISEQQGGHHDDIRFYCADYCWITWPAHERDGWHLQDHVAWGVLTKEGLPRIESEGEARKFLLRLRVPAGELGVCTATGSNYCFRTGTNDHCYEVTRDNGVHLYLKKSRLVSDH